MHAQRSIFQYDDIKLEFHTSGMYHFHFFTLLIPISKILTELVSPFFTCLFPACTILGFSLLVMRYFGLLTFGRSKCWDLGGLGD